MYAKTKLGLFFGNIEKVLENYVSRYEYSPITNKGNPSTPGKTYGTLVKKDGGKVLIAISQYTTISMPKQNNIQASVFSERRDLVNTIIKELEDIKELSLFPAPKIMQKILNSGAKSMDKLI